MLRGLGLVQRQNETAPDQRRLTSKACGEDLCGTGSVTCRDISTGVVGVDGIDAAEEWLDAWVGQANTQAARSVELSRRVAALTSTAEGRGGAIRVTVGSAGQ